MQTFEPFGEFDDALSDADHEKIRNLVAKDPSLVNRFCELLHEPALCKAIRDHRSFPLIDLLLELGADINAHYEEMAGDTPLDKAIHEHDSEMVQYLIDRGANPNIPTWMWITAIDRVAAEASRAKNQNERDELVALYELMLPAARKFDPPTYPDGTVPEFWPPTLEVPNPKRVAPRAQDREP